MNKDELKSIFEQHRLWIVGNGGERAELAGVELRGANLQRADLQSANLQRAYLQHADLQGTDLKYSDLQGADLKYSDLRGTDLKYSDLQSADLKYSDLKYSDLQYSDLQYADLRGADLRYADLDYSCLPLWCGSKGMKVDRRIAAQIAAHFCALDCDDEDYQAAREAILEFARTSHRAMDLGLLEERER